MKNRTLHTVLLGLLAIGLTGCVTSHNVRVDALSTGEGRGGSYELVSVTPGVEEGDLFFKEVTRFLEPALADKRFYPAKDGEMANFLIEVDAHLSDPMTESESYSEPVYMETRGHYRPIRIPVMNSEGQVVRYTYSGYWSPPRSHMAGWIDNERQITVYDKILRLSARRILGEEDFSDEIWAVTIALRDESTDYRSSLPYMLVAAAPYIGDRTEGEEIIRIKLDSEEVQAYRDSLSYGR